MSSHKTKTAVELRQAPSTGSPRHSNVFDDSVSHVPPEYRGTTADQHDMDVLGKKQVLRVRSLPGRANGSADFLSETSVSSPCWALPQQP